MARTVIRWTLFFAALFVLGPLAWLATGRLHGPDGGHETSPLLSGTPVWGVILALGAVGLAALVGFASTKAVHPHNGMFNAGMVLTWAAFGTGTIEALARASLASGTSLGWRLTVEGALLAVVGGISAVLIGGLGTASAHVHAHAHARPGHASDRPGLPTWGVAIACGIVGGFIGAWLVAQNSLKGQTVAAGAMAAIIGCAGAMLADARAPQAGALVGVCLMAAIGPLAGTLMHGSGERGFSHAAIAGTLLPAARVMPLDWLAGAFLGAPMGLALGGWITEGRHGKAGATAAA